MHIPIGHTHLLQEGECNPKHIFYISQIHMHAFYPFDDVNIESPCYNQYGQILQEANQQNSQRKIQMDENYLLKSDLYLV